MNSKYITVLAALIIIVGAWFVFDRKAEPVATDTTDAYSTESASSAVVTASSTISTITSSSTPHNSMNIITIETNKGSIIFETYNTDAPKTVENFITLAQKNFYNGVIFHRVISGFMIQGGDPTGTGRGGPEYKFADELNPVTESYKKGYTRGTVAMANSGPNTNGSQFFIMHKDRPLPNAYTIFGHVISGMEVVDAIAASPVDGDDRPIQDVVMKKVTVAEKR
jgi:cyclophilin family peptidyl-prolyl cis-trans isomerase